MAKIIELNLDYGGMAPIVEAFNGIDYNQDFEIIISHTRNRRVRVEKYPLLCSMINEIRCLGNQVTVNFNCDNECSQLKYAERMGFLTFMGVNYNYGLNKNAGGGRFVEIRNIAKAGLYYPAQDLIDVFSNDFNFTKNQAEEIALVLSELANNCHMHSECKGGAVFYCQKYPAQQYLNFFVVDSGIGIFNAMNQVDKYKGLDEMQTLSKSLEFGEGNGKGHGQGLYLVSEFIKRNGGAMNLVTGSTICLVQNKNIYLDQFDANYKGVILHLKIPFKIKVFIEDLMTEKMQHG